MWALQNSCYDSPLHGDTDESGPSHRYFSYVCFTDGPALTIRCQLGVPDMYLLLDLVATDAGIKKDSPVQLDYNHTRSRHTNIGVEVAPSGYATS
jgi:hypothetical protein